MHNCIYFSLSDAVLVWSKFCPSHVCFVTKQKNKVLPVSQFHTNGMNTITGSSVLKSTMIGGGRPFQIKFPLNIITPSKIGNFDICYEPAIKNVINRKSTTGRPRCDGPASSQTIKSSDIKLCKAIQSKYSSS